MVTRIDQINDLHLYQNFNHSLLFRAWFEEHTLCYERLPVSYHVYTTDVPYTVD